MSTTKKSNSQKFKSGILKWDMFKQSFKFLLPNGETSLPSWSGTIMTALLIFLLGLYAS